MTKATGKSLVFLTLWDRRKKRWELLLCQGLDSPQEMKELKDLVVQSAMPSGAARQLAGEPRTVTNIDSTLFQTPHVNARPGARSEMTLLRNPAHPGPSSGSGSICE